MLFKLNQIFQTQGYLQKPLILEIKEQQNLGDHRIFASLFSPHYLYLIYRLTGQGRKR